MSAAYVILKAIMKRSTIGWLLIAHISIALASNSGRVIARVRADTPQVTWGATDTANVVPLGGQCGGRDYTGPTTCQLIPDARVECVFINTLSNHRTNDNSNTIPNHHFLTLSFSPMSSVHSRPRNYHMDNRQLSSMRMRAIHLVPLVCDPETHLLLYRQLDPRDDHRK
ncbi:hypothetical protein CC1G_10241 [Coprinopsis cinerea okayama7|uniref:CBM1 domain-containing protein n=1 Tax=Coprinopsis cinerea (strain Okayama-7 / 130 / ATCC MYA-4618 / FGSC 9003) TaxID=240176 RepID=A8NPD7_COPC7|nr:hypothetical protein CC1G_10241 [Coprinopsis cinerea okayama7\|eukprot:XP_001835314.2 hypothetical protein CC1G_10241 [Coprinopsis cinerea okayama7\